MDLGKKGIFNFSVKKTQLASFDCFNNFGTSGAIDVKVGKSVFEEQSYFSTLGFPFSSNYIGALPLFLLLILTLRKLES